MKTHPVILAMATLLISGGIASAQMQYDSLGSPTPRPNQNVSPNTNEPNVPSPSTTGQGGSTERAVPPKADINSLSTTGQAPNLSSGNAGTEKTNGLTPGGLTPD